MIKLQYDNKLENKNSSIKNIKIIFYMVRVNK